MRNYKRLDADLRSILGVMACIIGLLAGSAFFGFMAEGPPHSHAEQIAARDWQLHTAVVTKLGQAFSAWNGQPVTEYVDMTYATFSGRQVTVNHKAMPAADKVNAREPVMVGRNGEALFINDPNGYVAPGQNEANWFAFLGFVGFMIIWLSLWTVLYLGFRRLAYFLAIGRKERKRTAHAAAAA